MSKPTFAPRKPPLVGDEFVFDGMTPKPLIVKAAKPNNVKTSKRVSVRVDGREMRRMTIHMPADLAKRVREQAAWLDVGISEYVSDVLDKAISADA